MIQKVLSGIGGVGNYGVISVVLFFVMFLGVLVWAFGLRRSFLDRMSRLPLESEGGEGTVLDSEPSNLNRHESRE